MASRTSTSKTLPCGRPLPATESAGIKPGRVEEWKRKLTDYLTAHKLKHSDQRWQIAELILTCREHLDAQGLLDLVKTRYPGIGAATVYRTIKLLCDAQMLKESLHRADGRVVYELFDEEHHDHIVCVDCGQIFEFHDEKIEAAQNAVVNNMRFTQVRHRHVIYVHCGWKS